MKKILLYALCLLLGAAAVIAIYRFAFRKSIPDAPGTEQVISILEQNDCFVCHSQNPDLPFYSSLPLIGPKMREHAGRAVKFTDLKARVCDNADEVTLSMLDYAVSYGRMPLTEYKLIHWGTGFNGKEKSVIASWVEERRNHTGPVRPLPSSSSFDAARAALGERMFNDTRISLDGTISCATCHVLENGGADHADERVSVGIDGLTGNVNSPTVYNSEFNVRQFWNGRAADLREQAEAPATNPVEMGNQDWNQICARLSADKELVREFATLYPGEGLTKMTVTDAIAEFEKTLITPDSRFDRYLKGETDAIDENELLGYEKFKEYACATCHTGVILGGRSFEHLGIFGDYFADRSADIAYTPDDDGLKGFTGKEEDLHRFKVPGLRNVALTAPYFHDGTVATMEDAVRAMAEYEAGREMPEADVERIVAFMRTLTGINPHLSHLTTGDINIRDPFILVEDGTYYMYASSTVDGIGGVAVYTGKDLQHWSGKVQVMTLPEGNWSRGYVWAPEVHKYNGRYYLFATINEHTQWKMSREDWPDYIYRATQIFCSDSPTGPFVPTSALPQTPMDYMALDGTLFVEDGEPYMVFCHEWVQIEDGTVEYVRLDDNLSKAVSSPARMFCGSSCCVAEPGHPSYVTDGCFMYRTKTGKLLMIWASFGPEGYAECIAESLTGKLSGPWRQQSEPLFRQNGGHAMIFTDLEGRLRLVLHAPNDGGLERAVIFTLEDTGETLKIVE